MHWWSWIHEVPFLQVLYVLIWSASEQLPEFTEHFLLRNQSTSASPPNLSFSVQLGSNGLHDSEHRQIVSLHFGNYFTDSSDLPYFSDIPCTYINCCSGCDNGVGLVTFEEYWFSPRGITILLGEDPLTRRTEFKRFNLFILVSILSENVIPWDGGADHMPNPRKVTGGVLPEHNDND